MFWKDYGKTVKRLWLNQFGGASFGLMLSFLSSSLATKLPDYDKQIHYISGVLGMFFYCYLIYLVIWETGAKDKIRAEGGRISERPNYGIKIALFYSIPSFAVTFIYFVAAFLYNIAGIRIGVLNGVVNVFGMLSMIFEMPYVGFAIALFGNIGKKLSETMLFPYAAFWLASCVPAALVIWGGYFFGYKGKFMSKLYKKKKD